jgi:hypothetical protein
MLYNKFQKRFQKDDGKPNEKKIEQAYQEAMVVQEEQAAMVMAMRRGQLETLPSCIVRFRGDRAYG